MRYDRVIAEKLKQQYDRELPSYKKMFDYYCGKTDINTRYKQNEDRANYIVKANYIKKFINEHVAYGVGSKITYTHTQDDRECIDDIEYNMQIQKSSLDSELYRNMLIFGKAYEMAYIYKDELRYRVTNPTNSIAYLNSEDEVEMFLYFYRDQLDDDYKVNIDCYCDEGIYHFDENFMSIKPMTPIEYTDYIPVSVAQLEDGVFGTLYNDIKEIQDAIEVALSDYINNSSDLRSAYMVLTGVEMDDEQATSFKSQGIILLPEKGTAEFLIKNIPSDYIKNLIDSLNEKVYEISQSINSNEAMQSNTSGQAIQSRIINLRNKVQIEQRALEDAIKNRIRILFDYIRVVYNKDYNYRDVKVHMDINVPSDDAGMADIISKIGDRMSVADALQQLSFVDNGSKWAERAENERIEKQKNDMNSIDDIGVGEDD